MNVNFIIWEKQNSCSSEKKEIMIDKTTIKSINSTLLAFFKKEKSREIVPAKELMPAFIAAGIFKKDTKNGKPIRDILRELDLSNQLELIPYLHAERNGTDTYWYFMPKNATAPTTFYKQGPASEKKELANQTRLLSDETYVLDLCDAVLEQKSARQKRFDFLLGDLHKDGVTRTKLPVDAYYPILQLVIDYKESPQKNTDDDSDKSVTASGLSRRAQQLIYDDRRATELPENGIKRIEISFNQFKCDDEKKIIRNPEKDLLTVKKILKEQGFLKK